MTDLKTNIEKEHELAKVTQIAYVMLNNYFEKVYKKTVPRSQWEKLKRLIPNDPDSISDLWHIDDVFSLDETLTKEQAREVLEEVYYNHDADIGINWDTIGYWIEQVKEKYKNIKYEVQHYTLCDGWINTWSTYDENDNPVPSTFDTKEEAQGELDEFFKGIEDDIKSGDRQPDEGYDPGEFRIVPISGEGRK